ncbi:MAG: DUF2087 domain-containing protein [Burkholderiales bacterium]|nr:MAG: DUF2087 domain-containing protein [Burkholderiales bacterium]TAG83073.1 MAG: DUF2087 domain-containing protein [Betaproteobacteria bacterium]
MSDAISSSPKTSSRSRERVSFTASDISALAKSLRASIAAQTDPPSQAQMLNWLAKGAGYQNYQSLRASASVARSTANAVDSEGHVATRVAEVPTAKPRAIEPQPAPLSAHAAKALTQFDELGRLHKWPHKFAVQRIAMWGLWMRFDAKKHYTEKEVNSVLKAWHSYGDHVTLRRELVNMQLLARKPDCSEYWKVAQQPNDEVKAFLKALRAQTER